MDRAPALEGKSMFMTLASVHKPRVHEHRIAGGRPDGEGHEVRPEDAPATVPAPEPTPVAAPAAEAAPAGE